MKRSSNYYRHLEAISQLGVSDSIHNKSVETPIYITDKTDISQSVISDVTGNDNATGKPSSDPVSPLATSEPISDRQADVSRCWKEAFDRLCRVPYPGDPDKGRELLLRHSAEWVNHRDSTEDEADEASRAYVACDIERMAFLEALNKWEQAVRACLQRLGDICHECGFPAVGIVVSDDGHRACGKCLGGGGQ
jgi:hypothetical protein